MILGVVESGEARIRVKVFGPRRRTRAVEAVIDTGYDGWLMLPVATIEALGLPWVGSEDGILADGSETRFQVYQAEVEWDGKVRSVKVDASDALPLVGMDLLAGYELKMQVRPKGKVTIKPLR